MSLVGSNFSLTPAQTDSLIRVADKAVDKISPEQAAQLAAVVSGRSPVAPPTDNTLERVWHGVAITICIVGVVGGVIMLRRAINDAEKGAIWYNPFTWSWAMFF